MALNESPFVTSSSSVVRPFYVVVDQIFLSNESSCLDLNDGDIFIVTKYNKVGYWWGVSVYDLNRQGWFPSTFVQPYTGEVPEEASEFVKLIKSNTSTKTKQGSESVDDKTESKKVINVVTQDVYPFQEYDSTMTVTKRGRETITVSDEGIIPVSPVENELDFDYETWAESKNEKRKKV